MRKGSRTAVVESLNKKENGQRKYFLLYQSEKARTKKSRHRASGKVRGRRVCVLLALTYIKKKSKKYLRAMMLVSRKREKKLECPLLPFLCCLRSVCLHMYTFAWSYSEYI